MIIAIIVVIAVIVYDCVLCIIVYCVLLRIIVYYCVLCIVCIVYWCIGVSVYRKHCYCGNTVIVHRRIVYRKHCYCENAVIGVLVYRCIGV